MKQARTVLTTAFIVFASGLIGFNANASSPTQYHLGGFSSIQQYRSNSAAPPLPRASGHPVKTVLTAPANTAQRSARATVSPAQNIVDFMAQRQRKFNSAKRTSGINPNQQQALAKLASSMPDQSAEFRAYFNRSNNTPIFVKFNSAKPDLAMRGSKGQSGETTARHFLKQNKDLLMINDTDTELSLKRKLSDQFGNQHFMYQQQVNGVSVWGSQLMLHLRDDQSAYLLNGRYQPSIDIDTSATLTTNDAQEKVKQHLKSSWVRKISSELVIYPAQDAQPRLAYKVDTLVDIGARWLYFIDAHSGEVLHRIRNIQHATVDASGTNELGTTSSFRAWLENSDTTYYMLNPDVPTLDASPDPIANRPVSGDTVILDARNGQGDQLYYSTSTSATSGWDSTAVSAMDNTMQVYNYYKNTHNRDSTDGAGKNLQVAIHFDSNYNNAFWNGEFMVYGDGDGQTFNSLARCLDVAAHEMTHGVIETSANLKYENQSGALNESFADIFGVMVDRDDWNMGEDCTVANPGFLRSMSNPASGLSSQPTKMSEYRNLPNTPDTDNGGVHINSGIPNRAAYLLADGLTAEGLGTSIGRAKTEQIFYRTLTTYLTSSSQFIDARIATIQAAEDLYGTGSAEASAVALAWDTVEVTDSGTTPPQNTPTETDPVTGDDIMVYVYPQASSNSLYAQSMNDPLSYVANLDVNIQNTTSANPYTRPAVYTDSLGTLVFYTGTDANIHSIDVSVSGFPNTAITNSGDIWSIALSPDGRYFSYTTTDSTDNHIYVIDLVNSSTNSYTITPPNYQDGNSGLNTNSVIFADALSFDYSSQYITFDALNCISTGTSLCADGNGYRYWSIGIMQASNGDISYPLASISPEFDFAYPTFAQNNNYVIAVDVTDYSQDAANPTSQVLSIDFENQQFGLIHDFGSDTSVHYGIPSFWGDDQAITILMPDATYGTVAERKALNTNGDGRWVAANGTIDTINPYTVSMPVMHRTGERTNTGNVSISSSQLNFGSININQSTQLSLTLSNTGNSDVSIINMQLNGSDFSHNGTNMLLPRGSSVTLTVNFNPTTAGVKTDSLSITSTASTSVVSVALTGTALDPNAGGDGGSSAGDSSGGGGAIDMIFLLLGLTLIRVRLLAKQRKYCIEV